MKIGGDVVRHVARLAELAIAEADVALLAEQLDGIVAFVAQLEAVELPAEASVFTVGPAESPLRDDVVHPIPMTRGPAEFAPVFEHGFFVVPKLGGMVEG